jgi:leader peptidase (prepilin peptidase)/N-methyltransferase
MTMIDFDTQLLPDQLTLPILWLGLIANAFNTFVPLKEALFAAIAGYMFLWTFNALFKKLKGIDGMGGGDFKLFAAIGAWGGFYVLPITLLLSSVVAIAIDGTRILLKKKDKNTPFAFGPFLAIAGWIALIWKIDIISFYLEYFI